MLPTPPAGPQCRFWQALFDSLLTHRKRWIAGGAAALLLLLIILLATLIPASRRKKDPGPAAPQFLQAPVVATTGATFFDISVELDQPAIVSYMVFPTSNQLQQVRMPCHDVSRQGLAAHLPAVQPAACQQISSLGCWLAARQFVRRLLAYGPVLCAYL